MPDHEASAVGWYFGMYPKTATLGTGVFALEKDALSRFRQRVDSDDGDRLRTICETLSSAGFRLSEPELKRAPPPYAADHRNGEHLRRKSLAAWRDFNNPDWLTGPDGVSACIETFRTLNPLNDWLHGLERVSGALGRTQ